MSSARVRPHADDLAAAVAAELHHRHDGLPANVAALMSVYRSGRPTLDTPAAALAYAAYRMPATHAAVAAALAAATVADLVPRTLLDIGGGTGSAVWAAATVFPTLTAATVLDRSASALRLGQRLAARTTLDLPRTARWTRATLMPSVSLPGADLVTMAYVLAELPDTTAAALVAAAGRTASAVAVVEPGTPAGHRRVLAARQCLLAQGMRVLAPCPHEAVCPLAGGGDWCHFGARLDRSDVHRRLKGGSLGYEDEKFAYVVAARCAPPDRAGRVVRRPQHRSGAVRLEVCTPADGVRSATISRRHGVTYRAARKVRWGDRWPAAF